MPEPAFIEKPAELQAPPPKNLQPRTKYFVLFLVALLISFSKPLINLFQFSLSNDLYSHVLLVPAISAYLVWLDKRKLTLTFEPARHVAVLLVLPGIALIATYWSALSTGWKPAVNDRLSLLTLAFLFCFAAGFAWFFGKRMLRDIAFPLAFLIFMVPMPVFLENGIVAFLQHGSADAAYLLLKLSGMPVFRDGLQFTMPGVSIAVAPECSGIRSSLVLFITGPLAAYFFLRKPWTRILLVAAVIPLGIFRNALRIFTLSQLAVHVNPNILDSDLHHRGGPLFFAVSLVPFFLLIWYFRKCENNRLVPSR